MSSNAKKHLPIPLFALLIVALSAMACGGETQPTKIGEVGVTPTISAPPKATGQQSQPTQTAAPTKAPTAAVSPTPVAPQNYKVGDIISIGDMVMVVLGWETPAGDQFSKPKPGNKFVAVDVVLVNQGKSTEDFSSMLQMTLKDETAQKYTVDMFGSIAAGASSPDGKVSPGERVRGKVGFQVPENAKGLVFVFDAELFSAGKVFVTLGDKPVAVEPPAKLSGETAQTTYKVGDVVQIGDLVLTVNKVSTPAGDQFNKPKPGEKFVVVDLTIENKSSKADSISSPMQMFLKDATGQRYTVDMMATVAAKGTSPDGELSAGEKIKGQVAYQVPEKAQGLVFVFDAELFGAGRVFVQLP